jgi:phospholipid/cholesterol/gamma-HCH transport system ATP-binding protein
LTPASNSVVVQLEHVYTRYGTKVVHEDVNLTVRHGERLGVVGGSGSGKSTLLREMIGLQAPSSGRVIVFGSPLYERGAAHAERLRERCGVLFQAGALFTDLSVYDNVALPLRERKTLDEALIRELVLLKLRLVGLDGSVAPLLPYQLSGGMVKRVGLARALAPEPELLFLDEPTSGLDPIGSENFVRVLGGLHADLGFTLVLVTHDLLTLRSLCDRVAVLAERRLAAVGTLAEVMASEHPIVRALFHGERGREVLGDRQENGHV